MNCEMMEVGVAPSGQRTFPLRMLCVGRASSLDFLVAGVPPEVDKMMFHVARPGKLQFSTVPAARHRDGRWHVYASGLYFPDVGDAEYHLSGVDGHGNSVWLGRGMVRILQSVLNPEGVPPIVPEDTYVRDPETGLWHKFNVVKEGAHLVPILDEEGVTR